jgi:uncharacterized membrane protein YciS (DUF1049 family)
MSIENFDAELFVVAFVVAIVIIAIPTFLSEKIRKRKKDKQQKTLDEFIEVI